MAAQPIPRINVYYFFRSFSFSPEGGSNEKIDVYPRTQNIYEFRHYQCSSLKAEYRLTRGHQKCVLEKGHFSPTSNDAIFKSHFTPQSKRILDKYVPLSQGTMTLTGLNICSILTIALSIPFFGYQLLSNTKVLTGRAAIVCNTMVGISALMAIFSQFVYHEVWRSIAWTAGSELYKVIQEAEVQPKQ